MAGDGVPLVGPQNPDGAGAGAEGQRGLEEKGLVDHETSGRTKIFQAALAREDAAAAETDSLLERAFHGSVGLLVSSLVERSSLTRADIDELYAILDKAEEESK